MTHKTPAEIIENVYNELHITQGMDFKLRIAQEDAIKAYLTNNFGLFDITCGCGKTLIQAIIIMLEIERCIAEGKQFVGLFVCHRLMLEDQIKFNYLDFFGDFFKRNKVEIKVLNSTGDNSFEKIARNNMQNAFGNHVIYMTTCASINDYVKNHTSKYQDGKDILSQKVFKQLSLYIHDESHKEYSDALVKCVLRAMKKTKAYFFTATPGEYLVKNLKTISHCTFAEAVKAGYIVKPVFYPVKAVDLEHLDYNAEANIVISAFKHLKKYKKDKLGQNEIPSLITFHDSVDAVRNVGDYIKDYKLKHRNFKANVYEIVSDKIIKDEQGGKVWLAGIRLNGERYNDGKLYTKKEILNIVKHDTKPKIILNAFMLTEGIDLPEINGVMILCQKTDSSLYQAISRGCRTSPNKENYFLYTLTTDELDKRMIDFLDELVKITDNNFDFGGIIEDVNNGLSTDNDDDESTGVPNEQNLIYQQIKISIQKKKTEFDTFKEERNQIEEFREGIQSNSVVDKLNIISKFSILWKDNLDLLNEFCSAEKIIGYLK